MEVRQGFTDKKGIEYKNIRNIHYEDLTDLRNNKGVFVGETSYSDNIFNTPEYRLNNGVYLFKSRDRDDVALRIYKDFADYLFVSYEEDARLVSKLQDKQKMIKLTTFPTGIITIGKSVIGQEIPYYEGGKTLAYLFRNKQMGSKIATSYYIDMLKILKELVQNGIIYADCHANNFIYHEDIVKLIDFEEHFISIDKDKGKEQDMLRNLKTCLIGLSRLIDIEIEGIGKTNTLNEMLELVQEKHYKLERNVLNK